MKKNIIFILILFAVAAVVYLLYPKEYEISSFSTSLADRDTAQKENITKASEKINNITLKPGEIFSFNTIVGSRTPANYGKAKTVVGSKIEDAFGGGVCQLSSTVYNAALSANLKIIERHPHNIVVRSVGPGLDATVSYGFYDLKFQNVYSFPIKINAKINNSRLIINIVGARRVVPNKINIIVETIPTYNGGKIHTRTWRETASPADEKTRELISEDTYN